MNAPTHAQQAGWAEHSLERALSSNVRSAEVGQAHAQVAIAQALLAIYGLLDERLDTPTDFFARQAARSESDE